MPTYPLRAIVLRRRKLGEADIIVSLLAEDGSQVRAVAKGARKTSSRLGTRLESHAEVSLLLATGRGSLDIVSEVEILEPNEAVREDLDRSSAAAVLAEYLEKAAQPHEPEERVFDLAVVTLAEVGRAAPDAAAPLAAAFLVKALALHGLRPQLTECVHCASRPAGGALRFSVQAGGVVCAACGPADPSALPISAAARDALIAMLGARMAEIPGLALTPATVVECLRLLASFAEAHLGVRLKSVGFLLGLGAG